LLDVNARAWGFHSIGMAAGVDFSYLLYADQMGKKVDRCRGRAGVGWLRLITDVPTAASYLWHSEMSLGSYAESLKRTRTESVFCWKDPLPAIAEVGMLPYLAAKKYLPKTSKAPHTSFSQDTHGFDDNDRAVSRPIE